MNSVAKSGNAQVSKLPADRSKNPLANCSNRYELNIIYSFSMAPQNAAQSSTECLRHRIHCQPLSNWFQG